MPSKKWQTSRSISSRKERARSRGKGSGLTDKGKRRRPGTPPQTVALPILSNPVLQRSSSRASSRYTSATMATLLHSRALRPTSPARNTLGARPRSRSLPVPLAAAAPLPLEKKRLRRLTLTNTSSLSRVLFDCENKENALHSMMGLKESKVSLDQPILKLPSNPIAAEMKTPEFHSSKPLRETPEFPPLPASENKDDMPPVAPQSSTSAPYENDSTILLAKRFDVLLPFAQPPTSFVGIDIDDTVVITNHSPSVLLTTAGVTTFQRFVHQKFSDFKTKNDLCRALEKAVKDKVLVEPNIPAVIRDLQDSGCWVFGVTARYHEMAVSTDKCLNSLGINLSLTSPFPPQLLRDPQTGAVSVNGIIYCNGLSKGTVLNRFFENVVLRSVLQSKNVKDAPSLPSSAEAKVLPPTTSTTVHTLKNRQGSSGLPSSGLPARFVFIDDQRSQAECICEDLMCARTLNIPVTCYHYVPEILRDPCENMDRRQCGQVLLKQMMYFIERKVVLSNQEALQLLRVPCPQLLATLNAPGGSPHEPVLPPVLSGIPTSTTSLGATIKLEGQESVTFGQSKLPQCVKQKFQAPR